MQSPADLSVSTSSFLNAGVLLLIEDCMGEQSIGDLHKSLLLSQLAADKKHNRHAEVKE